MRVMMHVRSSSDVFTMEKKPNPPEPYYVLISYKPYDERLVLHNNHLNGADYHYCTDETRRTGKVRVLRSVRREGGSSCMEEVGTVDGAFTSTLCKYSEYEAWCCIGELTDEQVEFFRERLSISGEWQRITEPKCKELTCDRTILLLPERDAVLRWWGAGKPGLRRPLKATLHFAAFIGDQKLGFEQCQALERCINLANEYIHERKHRGKKNGEVEPAKSVAEQKIKVDLHSWESAATLEELSRTVGIEPTEEFDTDGWIAEYLKKMGFASHIQNYEDVEEKLFGSEPAGKKGKGKKQPGHSPVPTDSPADRDGKTADERLRDYIQTHPGSETWTCVKLGEAIGISDGAVRQTAIWKYLSKDKRIMKKMNTTALRLNDERLSETDRKMLAKEHCELEESLRKHRVEK